MGSSLSLSIPPPATHKTTLLSLPNELLLLIATNLDRPSYIHPLLLTNRRLHSILTHHLYTFSTHSVTLSPNETLTALQWAAYKGHTPLLRRLLLSPQTDLNAHNPHPRNRPSSSSSTALHHAINRADTELVRLLLQAGARCDIPDAYGDTAVHRAVIHATTASSTRFLSWLPFRSWGADMEILRMLLDKGVDLDIRNNKGDTPLHHAVAGNSPCAGVMVEMLLREGAAVSPPNGYKYTPLHLASQVGRVEVVRVLMRWGADVAADGEWCLTPVKLATARGFKEVVKVLGEGRGVGVVVVDGVV